MVNMNYGAPPAAFHDFRVGDVIGRSFELFRRRFTSFLMLALIGFLPSSLLGFVMHEPGTPEMNSEAALTFAVSFVISLVCSALAAAAVTYGVVQELRGRSFTVSEALQAALGRLLPLIGVGLCVGLAIVLGMVALIVPGLMVMCLAYVAGPVCLVERQGVFASISRSAALTKGHRWQIFGIVLLLFVISIVMGLVVGFVIGFGAALLGATSVVQPLVNAVSQTLVGAFSAVLVGVLYFRLRTVKEGLDLDQVARVFE